MYYRPREKKRSPFLTFVLTVALVVMTSVLLALLGIYVGYLNIKPPDVTTYFQPTPTPTRPAVLHVADGDAYFAQGKIQEAIDAYEEAIRLDSEMDVAYIRQSRLLVYARDTAKALQRAEQAVILNPASPENLAYYCRALDWEAKYGAAYDACSCAIEMDPTYAEGYAFLSEVYADQGDWRTAKATAEEALEVNFQSMDAHHNMGYALEVQGRYAQALEFYENAIVLAPTLAQLYIDAGLMEAALGDYEAAAGRYKKAIKLTPFDPEPYSLLGQNYGLTGDYIQGIDALEQSIGVNPNYVSPRRGESAWGHLGWVYYIRANYEKAIELFPRAIELGEREYLRRARDIEIYTESQTLTGPTSIPVLRGQFVRSDNAQKLDYVALIEPVVYTTTLDLDPDQSCGSAIAQSIKNEAALLGATQSLSATQTFSRTGGIARLDLVTGDMTLELEKLPQPELAPYEIRVNFWPNRTETIGYFQPDPYERVKVDFQFDKELSAPVEYYYLLGLAYAYLDPPLCQEAIPWLLKSLEIDSSGWSPAWAGLRLCPSADSPPTPIPTFTPLPEEENAP